MDSCTWDRRAARSQYRGVSIHGRTARTDTYKRLFSSLPCSEYTPKGIYCQGRFILTLLCTYSNIPIRLGRSKLEAMEEREIKGLQIAAKSKLTRKGKLWLVPSQTTKEQKYKVAVNGGKPECTCRDHEFTNDKCKHIFAVEYTIEREQTSDGQTITTETVKVTRKQ